jgi:hypothetical protein
MVSASHLSRIGSYSTLQCSRHLLYRLYKQLTNLISRELRIGASKVTHRINNLAVVVFRVLLIGHDTQDYNERLCGERLCVR